MTLRVLASRGVLGESIRWKVYEPLAKAVVLGGAYLISDDRRFVIFARRTILGDVGRRRYHHYFNTVEYQNGYGDSGGQYRDLYDGQSIEKAKAAAEAVVNVQEAPPAAAGDSAMQATVIETYQQAIDATPGLYVVHSGSEAYFPMMGLIETGSAVLVGEVYDDKGRIVTVQVTTAPTRAGRGPEVAVRRRDPRVDAHRRPHRLPRR